MISIAVPQWLSAILYALGLWIGVSFLLGILLSIWLMWRYHEFDRRDDD